jgi:Lon protease-like protein
MVIDAAETDGLIGMVLLKSGWEDQYYGNPPVHETACMGQVFRTEVLPDVNFNVLLYGIKRLQIQSLNFEKPYQRAKVQVIEENASRLSLRKENEIRRQIVERLNQILVQPLWGFSAFSAPHLDLGIFMDFIAFSFPFHPSQKQIILETINLEKRGANLIKVLDQEKEKGKRSRMKALPFLHELAKN